jgi:outer membrane protein assembly factor BamB
MSPSSDPTTRLFFVTARAIDPVTGQIKWEFRYTSVSGSAVLSTASGLVFAGDGDGNIMAFDSAPGKTCGTTSSGSRCERRPAPPMCATADSTCWCRPGAC